MRAQYKITFITILALLIFWISDSIIEALIFRGQSFLDHLILDVPSDEIYLRAFIIIAFGIYGLLMSRAVKRRDLIQRKLSKRERELFITLNSIADAVMTTDMNGKVTFMNPLAESLTGWKMDEAAGKPLEEVLQVIDALSGERCASKARDAIESGEVVKFGDDCILISRRGIRIPVSGSLAAIRHEANNHLGAILAFRDISLRKQAEEQNRYHALLMEKASDAVISWSPDFIIKSWNTAAENIYGWKAAEVIGKDVREIISTEYRLPEKDMRAVLDMRGAWKGEVIQTAKDGRKLDIMFSVTRMRDASGQELGMMAINRDISDRVAAENALRLSEEKFRTLSELSMLAIFIYRGQNVEYYNEAFVKLFELSREELNDFHLAEFLSHVHEEDRHLIREQHRKKSAGESDVIPRYTYRLVTSHKEIRWIDLYSRRITYTGDQAVLVSMVDITDRVLAEKRLFEQKERLDVTLRSIGDGVIATDEKGRVLIINKVAEELTGWSEAEAFGKPLSEVFNIINEKTRIRLDNPVERVLKTGSIISLDNHTILVSRDGYERVIADSGAPIKDKTGAIMGVVLVFRDFTETRRLQDFASQAQRLETAGRIAAQVAHDFNNLLGPLTAYPALIREELAPAHPAMELVDQIEKSALQISEINQQLLTLGRRGHYSQKPLNINKVVMQVIRQFHPLSETMQIETNLGNSLFNIKGGAAQIYRVIANLVANAFDAMSGVGKLSIKTENFYADEITGKGGRIPQGEYVKLTISDTGIGISPEIMPKIFDPFFTTKSDDSARGSGLGLSVVHAVVEDHGGFIDCASQPGRGATFYVYFPITREAIEDQIAGRASGGSEKILIIDDDPTQREVTRILLEKLGYSTRAAKSGEEGLGILQQEAFDLLVLDMIMPGGLDGTETYRRALEINPAQKAILVSGYAESRRVHEAIELGAGLFLRKPVTIKSLGNAARKALDEPAKSRSSK